MVVVVVFALEMKKDTKGTMRRFAFGYQSPRQKPSIPFLRVHTSWFPKRTNSEGHGSLYTYDMLDANGSVVTQDMNLGLPRQENF